MTHPHLHALAMRTAAAETARTYRDRWRCANGFEGFATGAKIINEAILALPLEAEHAALLAEAVKLPEIAALIEASKMIRKYVEQYDGPKTYHMKSKFDAALSALETP